MPVLACGSKPSLVYGVVAAVDGCVDSSANFTWCNTMAVPRLGQDGDGMATWMIDAGLGQDVDLMATWMIDV